MTTTRPKTATITLRSGEVTMRLIALRRAGGSATSFVTTTAPGKKAVRGMTTQHPTFEEAQTVLSGLATQAEKLGWSRRAGGRGFVARPDAFAALPAAPKAPVTTAAAPKGAARK
jgi:hypothetical protein